MASPVIPPKEKLCNHGAPMNQDCGSCQRYLDHSDKIEIDVRSYEGVLEVTKLVINGIPIGISHAWITLTDFVILSHMKKVIVNSVV